MPCYKTDISAEKSWISTAFFHSPYLNLLDLEIPVSEGQGKMFSSVLQRSTALLQPRVWKKTVNISDILRHMTSYLRCHMISQSNPTTLPRYAGIQCAFMQCLGIGMDWTVLVWTGGMKTPLPHYISNVIMYHTSRFQLYILYLNLSHSFIQNSLFSFSEFLVAMA